MTYLFYNLDCRDCYQGISVVKSITDSELEDFQGKTEYEVIKIIEDIDHQNNSSCSFCGSHNLEILEIDMNQPSFSDFERIKEADKGSKPMAYITLANTNKIIFNSDKQALNLTGEIYKIPIYFFSKYEENALLAIQELLKDPEKYFTDIYVPYESKDTYSYIYEGQQPAYHKYPSCPRLHSDYQNFEIPETIQEKGPNAVNEFREWFEEVKHLMEKPDIFVTQLHARWGIVTNPSAINKSNSGFTITENSTVEELEDKIDSLIKEAGRFYYKSDNNTEILKRFSKFTFLAYKQDDIYNNDTGFTDEEVKELLKFYDEEFKRPLKKLLIEYYRLKLNPDIQMEGYLLKKLGFNPCGYCHDENYQPKDFDRNSDSNNSSNDDYEDDLPF